jgi:hypothetical protein
MVGAGRCRPLPVRGRACRLAQNGGSQRRLRSVDMARCSSFMPLMPSISAVVHLDEHREAVALQPLDQRAFPGRAHQVQRRAVQAPDQLAQLALAARPGQRGMAHVVLEVDVVVLDPAGSGFLLKAYFSRRFQGA